MTDAPDPSTIDIAAYWQFRAENARTADPTLPDNSLELFLASEAATNVIPGLLQYAAAALASHLEQAIPFDVGTSDAPVSVLCDGTNSTRADLALLALYGQGNPNGSKIWIDTNGKATVLTGEQLVALATLAGSWITDCYGALAAIYTQITQDKPSITKKSQIDEFVWPTS